VLFFNLTVVIAHKPDWAVFALVLPFPRGIFWIPFWKENELPERNFSFQNGSTSFRLLRRDKRRKGKSPEVFRGSRI